MHGQQILFPQTSLSLRFLSGARHVRNTRILHGTTLAQTRRRTALLFCTQLAKLLLSGRRAMGPVMPARLEARRLLVGQLLKVEVVHGRASSFCGFWGRLVIRPLSTGRLLGVSSHRCGPFRAAHLVHLLIFRVVEAAARARLSQQHFCQPAQEDTSQTTVQDHVPAQPGEVSIVLNKITDPVRLHEQNHFVSHTCHQPGVHPEERTNQTFQTKQAGFPRGLGFRV